MTAVCEVCGGRYPSWDDGHIHVQLERAVDDPTVERLVAMGFQRTEVGPLVARARAGDNPDPYRYALRELMQ